MSSPYAFSLDRFGSSKEKLFYHCLMIKPRKTENLTHTIRMRRGVNIFLIWRINEGRIFLQVAQAYSGKENPKFPS